MDQSRETKILVITGAAGRIAYSLLPFLCDGQIFGHNVFIELRLLDIESCAGKLEGVKMELEDSGLPFLINVIVTTDPDIAFFNADVAILLGGFPRLPGMERRDLISKNIDIMRAQGTAINNVARKSVLVLVVANPANTNCLVCMSFAKSIPKENFSCLTRLDHERLRGSIAEKCSEVRSKRITHSAVKNVAIFGNHSTTQVPYIGGATVELEDGALVPVTSILNDKSWLYHELIPKIQTRGAAIIKAQQVSSAVSAACAISKHLRDWIGPVQESNEMFSMGILSTGNPYGVPEGLVYSFPCIRSGRDSSTIRIKEGLALEQETTALLQASALELINEREEAEGILGVKLGW